MFASFFFVACSSVVRSLLLFVFFCLVHLPPSDHFYFQLSVRPVLCAVTSTNTHARFQKVCAAFFCVHKWYQETCGAATG